MRPIDAGLMPPTPYGIAGKTLPTRKTSCSALCMRRGRALSQSGTRFFSTLKNRIATHG
jgi:hypothetical protein